MIKKKFDKKKTAWKIGVMFEGLIYMFLSGGNFVFAGIFFSRLIESPSSTITYYFTMFSFMTGLVFYTLYLKAFDKKYVVKE
jgi:hypothetical protein